MYCLNWLRNHLIIEFVTSLCDYYCSWGGWPMLFANCTLFFWLLCKPLFQFHLIHPSLCLYLVYDLFSCLMEGYLFKRASNAFKTWNRCVYTSISLFKIAHFIFQNRKSTRLKPLTLKAYFLHHVTLHCNAILTSTLHILVHHC